MNIQIREMRGDTDWGWFTERNSIKQTTDTCGMTAYNADTGEIVGITVFDTFAVNSCHCHVAVDGVTMFRHGCVEAVFDMAFNRMGLKMLIGTIQSSNKKALRFNRHLGFKENSRVKDAITDGVDMITMVMMKDQCRYLKDDLEVA